MCATGGRSPLSVSLPMALSPLAIMVNLVYNRDNINTDTFSGGEPWALVNTVIFSFLVVSARCR